MYENVLEGGHWSMKAENVTRSEEDESVIAVSAEGPLKCYM